MSLLRKRYDGHWPSQLSVISGPSRTADIEKILVMGAHGPKRLVLFFAD
jgi:L-lactate dehydrogenase complex protein LldG